MRTLLRSHYLWRLFIDTYNEETMMTLRNGEQMLLRENRKKDNKSLGLIQRGLDDMILSKVSNAESLKKAWDTL